MSYRVSWGVLQHSLCMHILQTMQYCKPVYMLLSTDLLSRAVATCDPPFSKHWGVIETLHCTVYCTKAQGCENSLERGEAGLSTNDKVGERVDSRR